MKGWNTGLDVLLRHDRHVCHTNTEGPAGDAEGKENTHREKYWGTAVAGPD